MDAGVIMAERSSLEASVATLNANYNNLEKGISSLAGEVRAGNLQNTQIIAAQAVTLSKLEDSKDYQNKCDEERKALREDVIAMKVKSAFIATFVSGLIGVGTLVVDIWKH